MRCQGSRLAKKVEDAGRLLLLQRLEHQELLEDLGLAGLPDLPRQEHLVHHRVHLWRGADTGSCVIEGGK